MTVYKQLQELADLWYAENLTMSNPIESYDDFFKALIHDAVDGKLFTFLSNNGGPTLNDYFEFVNLNYEAESLSMNVFLQNTYNQFKLESPELFI